MKSFAQFVVETAGFTSLSASQFPLIGQKINANKKAAKVLESLLATMNKAVADDNLEKKDLTTLQNSYRTLTGMVAKEWETKYPERCPLPGSEGEIVDENKGGLGPIRAFDLETKYNSLRYDLVNSHFHSNFQMHHERMITRENPFKKYGPRWAHCAGLFDGMVHDWVEVAHEFEFLVNAIGHVATLIPTKARLAAKAAFNAPKATKDARSLIERVLLRMTDEIKRDLENRCTTRWTNDLEEFFSKAHEDKLKHLGRDEETKAKRDAENADLRRRGYRSIQHEPHYLESFFPQVCQRGTFHPLPNWKNVVQKMAVEQADSMQRGFVDKNISKLASIVERKGNLEGDPKIISIGLSGNAIPPVVVGELEFNFKDGSSFRVRSKVVWQYRYGQGRGISFTQFPTTFHDAKLPDGKHMVGMPRSEDVV